MCMPTTYSPTRNEAKVIENVNAGFLINCGSTTEVVEENGLKYVPDHDYISVGNITTINKPGVSPRLTSLRYFNDTVARKFCYTLPVNKAEKFLVRATYYYGGYDGGKEPPIFDQIIDGTLWGIVNTTEDYANGLSSYYEIVVKAQSNSLSVCLARNGHTVSNPFISALEVLVLSKALYNATDFSKYALATIARTSFGPGPDIIRYVNLLIGLFYIMAFSISILLVHHLDHYK